MSECWPQRSTPLTRESGEHVGFDRRGLPVSGREGSSLWTEWSPLFLPASLPLGGFSQRRRWVTSPGVSSTLSQVLVGEVCGDPFQEGLTSVLVTPQGVQCDGSSTFPRWGSDRHKSHPSITPSAPQQCAEKRTGLQCRKAGRRSPIHSFTHSLIHS